MSSPAGISATSVDHLAPDLQPWKQKPICWQAPRPPRASGFIDMRPVLHLLVAELLGAGFQDLVVVAARQARNAVGAGRPHLVFGLVVPGLHLGERDRPVEKACARHIAVDGLGLELVLLEAQRGAGPMHGRAADRLHDPGGKAREILGDPPGARRGPLVEPGNPGEHRPFVVLEILHLVAPARFQADDAHALLGEFVGERAAAGAGAYDHDNRTVIEIKWCSHVRCLPQSQSMSSKPRPT